MGWPANRFDELVRLGEPCSNTPAAAPAPAPLYHF
jgi:hypothetical protein